MTPRLARCAAGLVALSCAAVADAGWWDDAGAARRTTLDEVRADPDRWRDVTVVFDVRFARVADAGNPFFTRFAAREWRAVAAFAAESAAESIAAGEPFARIFVRRGSENEKRLAGLTSGRRVQLRAAVRDAVKGEPWIEVFDVVADGDPLTPEESAVLARGEQLLASESPAAAETLLRGLAGKRILPKAVQADVWRKIGAACWAQRRIAEAADAFAASLAAAPDDAATAEKLSAARRALAARATADKPVEFADAAAIAATRPALPASLGRPLAAPPLKLLPPAGIADAPAPPAEDRPAPRPPTPTPTPADGEPSEEPAPPPKPTLSGPR